MLFHSAAFALLVGATLPVYYGLGAHPRLARGQVPLLIAASFVFYAHHDPRLLLLLLASLAVNSTCSRRALLASDDASARRFAVAGVAANLALLGAFKYGGLLAATAAALAERPAPEWLVSLPLPLGISFFTFQGMSLVIDSHRARRREALRDALGERDWHRNSVFFVAFFPQLVAGPIVKAHEFQPQIGPKRLGDVDWDACTRAIVTGLFFKRVVADNLAAETAWIAWPWFEGLHALQLAGMLLGYSMQIFADFAGYSWIAIGVAGLFGYRLPRNFDAPYVARSFSEFWRRWHISLSTWLRDYLYIPLGGSRGGRGRTALNLSLVMGLGGLWHGAAWSYAVWGGAHGLALILERALRGPHPAPARGWAGLAQGTLVFGGVTLAWLLFCLPAGEAVAYLAGIATRWDAPLVLGPLFRIALFSLPVIVLHVHALAPGRTPDWRAAFRSDGSWATAAVAGAMLFALVFDSGEPGDFIYFQF